MNEILTMYSNKTLSLASNKKSVNIINDIGPQTKVELFERRNEEETEQKVLIGSRTYENQDSCPNSPSRYYFSNDFNDDLPDDGR